MIEIEFIYYGVNRINTLITCDEAEKLRDIGQGTKMRQEMK